MPQDTLAEFISTACVAQGVLHPVAQTVQALLWICDGFAKVLHHHGRQGGVAVCTGIAWEHWVSVVFTLPMLLQCCQGCV